MRRDHVVDEGGVVESVLADHDPEVRPVWEFVRRHDADLSGARRRALLIDDVVTAEPVAVERGAEMVLDF